MTNEEFKEKLKKIITEHPKSWTSKKYLDDDLKDFIMEQTKALEGDSYTWSTRAFWILNDIHTFEECLCPVCHKPRIGQNVLSFNKGYTFACSQKCASNSQERKDKIKKTCLEKFGSESFLGSEQGEQAKKDWCEKQGVANPFQLDWVNEKASQTRKEHFGYEYTMQSPEKRKLASENYKKKTGYDSQFKDPEVIKKIKEKREENVLNGIDERAKFKENARHRRYKLFCVNEEIVPNFTEDDFCKLDAKTQYTTLLSWHCKKCGADFESYLDQNFSSRFGIPTRCVHCHPFTYSGVSNLERDLYEFLLTLDPETKQSDRTLIDPLELDCVSFKHHLCFEFDGLHWHSESNGKNKYYHLTKTEKCEEKGYQLIHIFEDEWIDKHDIVTSRIKNLFGVYDNVVFARKCEVRDVPFKEASEFLDKNHIQGSCSSKVNLGLYHNDELVSLMTFGKSRFDRKVEWELLRFCNKLNYHVPGAASRLLKHFETDYHPSMLVSYADRRWSIGNLYEKLGFMKDHISEPSYFYENGQKRFSRITFQKHKQKDILPIFDENKTEYENMLANGYDRIYDCGNYVFIKKKYM